MHKLRIFISLFLLFFTGFTSFTFAQFKADCAVYSNHYIFDGRAIEWNKRLPNSVANDMELDDSGKLWIAVNGGLWIDGEGYPAFFSHLNIQVSPNVREAFQTIFCLKKDGAGNIWIGTAKGLLCFDGTTIHEIPVSADLPFRRISHIAVDQSGNIWVSGSEVIEKFMKTELVRENCGIACFTGEKWKSYTMGNSDIPCPVMRELTPAADGGMWMLGDKGTGIVRWKDGQWTVFNTGNAPIPTDHFKTISLVPGSNRLLFGWEKGVVAFDGSSWKEDGRFKGINGISDILAESEDTIWIGTAGRGLFIQSGWVRKSLHSENSPLMNNHVEKIIAGPDGMKWLMQPHIPFPSDAETYGGVCGLNIGIENVPLNWNCYSDYNSTFGSRIPVSMHIVNKDEFVLTGEEEIRLFSGESSSMMAGNNKDKYYASLMTDSGEFYFISKENGLCKWNKEGLDVIIANEKGTFPKGITRMLSAGDGTIWISTINKGVIKCAGSELSYLDKKSAGLSHNDVNTVYVDSQKRLWAGTDKGVCVLDGGAFTSFDKKNSALPHNKVFAICEDREGNLYIGTQKGAAVYKDGTMTEIRELSEQKVVQLECDKENRLWIGTEGSGLLCRDGNEYVHFMKDSVLDYYKINLISISPDKDRIWISASFPKVRIPKFNSYQLLREAEERVAKFKDYKETELSKEIKAELAGLKKRIPLLKKKAHYENMLGTGIRNLTPSSAMIEIKSE